MKKSIIAIALLFSTSSFSQLQFAEDPYFTISSITEPLNKSIGSGAEIEIVGKLYARAGVTVSEENIETILGIGLSLNTGYFESIRYYIGGRIGANKRDRVNAMAGAEIGIDFNLTDNFFIGARGILDYKSDTEFYNEPDKMEPSAAIRLGFKF